MTESILIYLSLGMVLWLLSGKSYLDNNEGADHTLHVGASILTTLGIIVLWPLWLIAILVYLGKREHE
jgi:hypothetical protein